MRNLSEFFMIVSVTNCIAKQMLYLQYANMTNSSSKFEENFNSKTPFLNLLITLNYQLVLLLMIYKNQNLGD